MGEQAVQADARAISFKCKREAFGVIDGHT